MKKDEVTTMLRSAVSNAAPDVLDNVLHACDHEKRKVIYMEKKKNRGFAAFAAVAAVFVLLIAGIFIAKNNGLGTSSNALAAVVSLDVNPSIELKVDKDEEVISATGLNADGKKVLEGMDLEDTDLDVAVNAIIGSMLKHGYLSEMQNSILLSVSGVEGYDANALETKLASEVNALLKDGAVLSQNVTDADDELVKKANEYGITVGKASLINEIVKNSKTHSFEQLAGLTINELNLISENAKLSGIKTEGKASAKSYIGKDAALSAALKAAGLTKDQVKNIEIELDYEHGVMVYEVEFDRSFDEYEYDIDAKTGAVVAYDNEINGKEVKFESSTKNDDAASKSYIGKDAALSAALKAAGLTKDQVRNIEIKLDNDDGVMVYEVEFDRGYDEYEYDINAKTGAIVAYDNEINGKDVKSAGSGGNKSTSAAKENVIGNAAAKSAALKHAGLTEAQATELKVELDRENGKLVYEVEFKSAGYEYDYEIDAEKGTIIKSDKELDD